MSWTRAIGRVLVIGFGAGVAAQQQPPFTTGTRTVAVFATVADAHGRLVPDLDRGDFAVDDNGKRQALTLFSNDVQPITVVLLLDRSNSMAPNFDLEEKAAEAFVRQMAIEDKARIGSFSTRVQVDPPEFTADHEALTKILRTQLQRAGPTPLWNAVNAGIDDLLLEQGRRVVLVFTDGVDSPMNFEKHNKSLKDVMKRAEDENIMVYAIGLAGENGMPTTGFMLPGQRGGHLALERPDEGLPKIAAATGGGYFELSSPINLAGTFARVADELHHQYALGFTPEALDGKTHTLTVRVDKPQLTVRARKSYVAARERP
jgi:VWFA-related protein